MTAKTKQAKREKVPCEFPGCTAMLDKRGMNGHMLTHKNAENELPPPMSPQNTKAYYAEGYRDGYRAGFSDARFNSKAA